MTLAVIIPTLNVEHSLPATLEAVQRECVDIVVVDGGSKDGTVSVASSYGAKVMHAERGRGLQLATGASGASVNSDWFLFLHGDTILPEGWFEVVAEFMSSPVNSHKAAVFRFALDADVWQARVLEKFVDLRSRVLALPYGDQGLLISCDLYRHVGGFRPIPLMEDVDIIRKIGRGRLSHLPCRAMTSARRWQADGWFARSTRNVMCLILYMLGVSPNTLQRLYGRG